MTDPSELRIQVSRQAGTVVTRQGKELALEAFLHAGSDLHPGAETLLDRLNHPAERFLPCRIGGLDDGELLSLEQVAYVVPAEPAPELESMTELGAHRELTRLELVTGEVLEGELVYLAPAQRRRLSDLFNYPTEPFLLMIVDDGHRYVHRDAVVRVRL